MPVVDPCLIHSSTAAGDRTVRLGVPLLDGYLDFVAARCRPNTVFATAHDLKVFFTLVDKEPAEVTSTDVLAFMTVQRHGGSGSGLALVDGVPGLSARTLRRRLSSVSGLFGYLHARGDVTINPVPRGLPTRREKHRPRQGVPLVRHFANAAADPVSGRGGCVDGGAAHPSGPGDGRGDGAGRAAPLRGPRVAVGRSARSRAAGAMRMGSHPFTSPRRKVRWRRRGSCSTTGGGRRHEQVRDHASVDRRLQITGRWDDHRALT
jgi:hypothetical protein